MGFVKGTVPVIVALAIISVATGVLWLVRTEAMRPEHLVFFYLFPIVLVAVLYGSRAAMLSVVAATMCAAFFLYEPLYSFEVTEPVELGELLCFAGLALIGAKCTADLLKPLSCFSRQNPAAPNSATQNPAIKN